MPRFLQSSIDEVLRRSDIVEIVSNYVSLRRNGNDELTQIGDIFLDYHLFG